MRIYVRTDKGAGWVSKPYLLVQSKGIIVTTTGTELRHHGSDDEPTIIPPGTPFVFHTGLKRQTARKQRVDQRTHLIVEEGIHVLERMCVHVQRFEVGDAEEMLSRSMQMDRVTQDLYFCGQLSFDQHARITENLSFVRAAFDEAKKAEKKIEVREHIDTADVQRSRIGRFRAMPAASAASASRRDIQARFKECVAIHSAFGTNALRVDSLLTEIRERVEVVWSFFKPNGGKDGLPRDVNYAMGKHRNRYGVEAAICQLEDRKELIEKIFVLPYRPMALAVSSDIERLTFAVDNHRQKMVLERVKSLQASLRRMLMLWYIETMLIRVISFPPRDKGQPFPTRVLAAFNERLAKLKARVRDLKDDEFDGDLRELVRDHLLAAENHTKRDSYEEARNLLKRLTRELHVRPTTSGRFAA
jgi:hypothetical protein